MHYPNVPSHEVIRSTARRYPDRTAIWMNGAGISCGELDAESSRLAHGLRALGADCAVTGVADAEAGEVPKAFVVPRTGRQIDLDGLARFVAERLAGYKQVRHFEVVGSIPRTPSGKILRRMLKESNR